MTDYCDHCGVGEVALEPLEGSGRKFCHACVSVVQALARVLERQGSSLDEIVRHISLRFTRPSIRD